MNFDVYWRSLTKNIKKGSERTHYPALKILLDVPAENIEATIEEKGNKAGIPDFTVRKRDLLLGYVEAKDIGLNLDQVEKTEQLTRYLESHIGTNFILTNYLEFRWYVDGKLRLKSQLGDRLKDDQLERLDQANTEQLIQGFLNYQGEIINNPVDLAKQMARLTKAIDYAVGEGLKLESETGELHQLKQGFQQVLLPDLDDLNFADMYAQTIAYGLFTARVNHAQNPQSYQFERGTAGLYIPATNPFLKKLFNTVVDTEAIAQINWAVDDLVQLLASVDMGSILEDFGQRTRQEDPVVHFYETFLASYDASLRKSRGVYYTPEPVVNFIVRSLDLLLKEKFNLPLGLADPA
ncbi:MAG: N-6 DNA methylase, partial [Microcoleaceae cyanobacterium]